MRADKAERPVCNLVTIASTDIPVGQIARLLVQQ